MEDTQKSTQEQELLIQEMLRDAKKTELSSELTANPVINKGDAELPAPMVVRSISSAGYVYVWDTRSYEKLPILYYMLPSKLRQRRPDGSFRFTTNDPGLLPKRGSIKCMLHLNGENRKYYDELGFRVCGKENITNNYQLRQHMLKKHPQEWKAIEEERTNKEKQEDRALQRLLLASQATKLESQPIATGFADTSSQVLTPAVEESPMYECSKCKAPHMFSSNIGKQHLEFKK